MSPAPATDPAIDPAAAVVAIARLVRQNKLPQVARSARKLASLPTLAPAAQAVAGAAERGNLLGVVAGLTRLAGLVDARRAA